jgi:hypothetical protein
MLPKITDDTDYKGLAPKYKHIPSIFKDENTGS